MAHAPVPSRIRRVQASALVLLVIAGTLNYVDRAALSIANPLIREELGLSLADMGLLLSAFLWAYAFSQLPGGALTDRLGPRPTVSSRLNRTRISFRRLVCPSAPLSTTVSHCASSGPSGRTIRPLGLI